MRSTEKSLPDVRVRNAPDGESWLCLVVHQCHLPVHVTNYYWEIRDPANKIVGSGMRDSLKAAHGSALQACKRRWAKGGADGDRSMQ